MDIDRHEEPARLEDGPDTFGDEIHAHLVKAPKRHLLRKGRDLANDGSRVRDFVSQAVYGPPKDPANDDEVGDDFFKPQPAERRRGVTLKVLGKIKKGLRPINTRESVYSNTGRRRKKGAGGAPLVIVEEAGPGEESMAAPRRDLEGASFGPSPSPSPVYGSTVASTVNSLESFSGERSIASSSRPHSPPLAFDVHFSDFSSPSPTFQLQPLTTTESSEGPKDLAHPNSRTLTIDESLLKPGRGSRRQRAAKTVGRALHHARKAHKARRGDATISDLSEDLEAELAEAGFLSLKEEYEVDVLWENQRGLVVFGTPKFAANALFAFDPAPWSVARSDGTLRDSPYSTHDHPLPTPDWFWDHGTWMVDMDHDVDEAGWSYAYLFHSKHWRGEAQGWRSYVRRRRWIRGRYWIPPRPVAAKDLGDVPIDWGGLVRNSDFAEAVTPSDGPAVDSDASDNEPPSASSASSALSIHIPSLTPKPSLRRPKQTASPTPSSITVRGLKTATALLPLSDITKTDVFSWEVALDARDPFLAWSFVSSHGDRVLADRRESDAPGSRSDEALVGLWRESCVEVNYHRVVRVLRECRVDREKLALWRWWLGQKVAPTRDVEASVFEFKGDPAPCGTMDMTHLAPNSTPEEGVDARSWVEGEKRPALEDVWDLLEARLDHIVQLFEFQLSRLHLLRLILTLHPLSHAHHQYRSFDGDEPFEPGVLSPKLLGSRLQRRMDFYTDVHELQKFYEQSLVTKPERGTTKDAAVWGGGKGKGKAAP